MEIRMLGTHRGSPDAHSVRRYEKDAVLTVGADIPDTLVCRFLSCGYAEEVRRPSIGEFLYQSLKPPTREQIERTFRPQPTRGAAPTNPATLTAKGEAV